MISADNFVEYSMYQIVYKKIGYGEYMSIDFENLDNFELDEQQSLELDQETVLNMEDCSDTENNPLKNDDIFNNDIFNDNPIIETVEAEENATDVEEVSSFDIPDFQENIDEQALADFDTTLAPKTQSETTNIPVVENNNEEPDLSQFMSEEIDFEAFMSDSPSPSSGGSSSGGTEEISLDDFGIDFSNSESISLDDFITPTEEKSDIIGDDPIDIQLSFDDSYVLSTAANPAEDFDTEFGEGFLPTGDETLDNFDDIFDSISDISEPVPEEQATSTKFKVTTP